MSLQELLPRYRVFPRIRTNINRIVVSVLKGANGNHRRVFKHFTVELLCAVIRIVAVTPCWTPPSSRKGCVCKPAPLPAAVDRDEQAQGNAKDHREGQ